MKARLIKDADTDQGPQKAGQIIDHGDAHLLVRLGWAEPADEECQTAVDEWQADRAAALERSALRKQIRDAERRAAPRGGKLL